MFRIIRVKLTWNRYCRNMYQNSSHFRILTNYRTSSLTSFQLCKTFHLKRRNKLCYYISVSYCKSSSSRDQRVSTISVNSRYYYYPDMHSLSDFWRRFSPLLLWMPLRVRERNSHRINWNRFSPFSFKLWTRNRFSRRPLENSFQP